MLRENQSGIDEVYIGSTKKTRILSHFLDLFKAGGMNAFSSLFSENTQRE